MSYSSSCPWLASFEDTVGHDWCLLVVLLVKGNLTLVECLPGVVSYLVFGEVFGLIYEPH